MERLAIGAGDTALTLDLHPRLTVVAGMGEVERASLFAELIGGLAGTRTDVHLELEERSGRRLAVARPTTGRCRVVDLKTSSDVTADLQGPSGACDLLHSWGIDRSSAQRAMRLGATDLMATGRRGEGVEVLAALDQLQVWAAAEALLRAEGRLTTGADTTGPAPDDAAVIEAVEARHMARERAAGKVEATRRRSFWIGGGAAAATVPATALAGPAGLGLLAVAAVSVMLSLVARSRLAQAAGAEERALAEAGASSYLGFQLRRADEPVDGDSSRQVLLDVAAARRQTLVDWEQLAGDIPVGWAMANRAEIEAAARLRREVEALAAMSQSAPEVPHDVTAELAQALVAGIVTARCIGGEGLPLVLDEPFLELDPSVKPMLLELLGRAAGDPQVIVLTDDEDIASWARLEALTGEVRLLEPLPEHDGMDQATQRIAL